MLSDVEAVEHDRRLAICAIKLDRHPLARILSGDLEDAPIPADAVFGILAAQRIKALALQIGIILEGQFHCPVMRQIDAPPVFLKQREVEPAGIKFPGLLWKFPAEALP